MLPQRQAVLVLSFCSIGPILPSRPTRAICWRAQRQSRMARLRATALAARSVLDGREHDQDANENRVTDKTCRQRYSQSTNGVHGGPSCVVIGLKPITRTNESTVTDLGGN